MVNFRQLQQKFMQQSRLRFIFLFFCVCIIFCFLLLHQKRCSASRLVPLLIRWKIASQTLRNKAHFRLQAFPWFWAPQIVWVVYICPTRRHVYDTFFLDVLLDIFFLHSFHHIKNHQNKHPQKKIGWDNAHKQQDGRQRRKKNIWKEETNTFSHEKTNLIRFYKVDKSFLIKHFAERWVWDMPRARARGQMITGKCGYIVVAIWMVVCVRE